jgi:AmiR/NasT family two-component response regulator
VDDSNPHTLWEDFFEPRSLKLDTHSAATDVYGAGQRLYHPGTQNRSPVARRTRTFRRSVLNTCRAQVPFGYLVTRPTLELHPQQLRVLIANEKRDRLELLARVVIGLGHDVIAREIYVTEVGPVTAREHPDVALVGLGESSEHALALISEIVREAACPVIAILHNDDPAYVHEAAKRGVFAYIIEGTPDELQSAIDITLQRFAEYQSLQGAFGRRAVIEQAKGILMARHAITAERAFERLRDHSQHNGRKLSDVAAAVVESHLLLLPEQPANRVLVGAALPDQK